MLKMPLVWGGAVALTAIIAFQAPLAAFVRARRAAWRERTRGDDGYLSAYSAGACSEHCFATCSRSRRFCAAPDGLAAPTGRGVASPSVGDPPSTRAADSNHPCSRLRELTSGVRSMREASQKCLAQRAGFEGTLRVSTCGNVITGGRSQNSHRWSFVRVPLRHTVVTARFSVTTPDVPPRVRGQARRAAQTVRSVRTVRSLRRRMPCGLVVSRSWSSAVRSSGVSLSAMTPRVRCRTPRA